MKNETELKLLDNIIFRSNLNKIKRNQKTSQQNHRISEQVSKWSFERVTTLIRPIVWELLEIREKTKTESNEWLQCAGALNMQMTLIVIERKALTYLSTVPSYNIWPTDVYRERPQQQKHRREFSLSSMRRRRTLCAKGQF